MDVILINLFIFWFKCSTADAFKKLMLTKQDAFTATWSSMWYFECKQIDLVYITKQFLYKNVLGEKSFS